MGQTLGRVLRVLRQAVGVAALRVSGDHAGFHLVWWPPPGFDVAALLARAHTQGLGLQPVAQFCRRVSWPAGVVIGYSARPDADLDRLEALPREVAGVS